MFDATVANSLGLTTLARAGTRTGFALEEAVKAKDTKPFRPAYKLISLAFSTCGEHASSVQDLVKELGKVKVEMAEDCLEASDQFKLGK